MGILVWDKPEKVMSTEKHNLTYVADGIPPGAYVSNMSAGDLRKWKARKVGFKSGHPQIEIRKDNTVIIVSLKGGYRYKHYLPHETEKVNIHIASAGPTQWTWQELEEFNQAVVEARKVLEDFDDER